jgi:hypothetical protein
MPLHLGLHRDQRVKHALAYCLSACACCGIAADASAHGIVGDRFFPATITTDDPFAADELALPTITAFNHETDYDFDYSKSIFPGFAVSVGAGYADGHDASGFSNVSVTSALELFRDEEDETILTAGFIWEIGGSGSKAVADRFSTYSPEVLFGQGFGDLPDSMALLRPFALTGQIGFKIPGTSLASKAVEWGGALEYSLRYLQTNVRDQGMPLFVEQLTPIVEYSFESPTDAGGGETTGTLNPGLIWSGQYTQFAVEAIVPVNAATGKTIGMIAQAHFYIDDIFPSSLGRPIFR